MTIQLQCHANCNDVFLAWRVDGSASNAIAGCLGYAVELRTPDGKIQALSNLKGFAADQPQTGQTQPSTSWPFQTFTWTDHTILAGAKAQFRVTAMMGQPGALTRGDSSDWSPWQELTPRAGAVTSAFFNRGFMLSQFVERYAKQHALTTMSQLKAALTSDVASPLMQFLTGELGQAIRGILKQARSDTRIELWIAMFELDLADVIDDLVAVGQRAHLLLANGAVSKAGGDENSAAAARLSGKVDLHRRMSAPLGLAHNKFVAITMDGKPFGVWTGSTNWSMTGFHTQANNGISIEDAGVAQVYLDQWHSLVAAGQTFPAALKSGNAKVHGPLPLAPSQSLRVWFTPLPGTSKAGAPGADIQDLIGLVNQAKEGILFVMFMPGQEPLNTILKRQEAGLYVRGVVSTLPMGKQGAQSGTFQIMSGQEFKTYSLDVVQPTGAEAVGDFLATFTRQDFLSGMGFAITHTKVIVIDPFGARPIVVTGSHNFSTSASVKNDENLVIIEGCPELARAYAVNCMAVHDHYRWPAYQHEIASAGNQGPNADDGFLQATDAWQKTTYDADKRADLQFWMAA